MNAPLFYISQLLGYRIFRWLFNFTFSWLFNFTKFWWYKVTYYTGFNPRPTLGTTNTNNTPTNAFQSTPPRGRRPVQIMPVPTLMCFNPRPHTRGDSPHGLPLWLCSVSIHAPTRGATQIDLPLKSITLFQSTPPRGGRPTTHKPSLTNTGFNPRPRAGGDQFGQIRREHWISVSIHAPARGATLPVQ